MHKENRENLTLHDQSGLFNEDSFKRDTSFESSSDTSEARDLMPSNLDNKV